MEAADGYDIYEIIEIKEEQLDNSIVIDDDEEIIKPDISYTCDVCFLSFICKSKKIEHCKTHIGEKLFKCEFCQKSYQKEHHLKEHINHVHTQMYPKYK